MNSDSSKKRKSTKIRIATAIILILCAVMASMAWAVFAGIIIKNNIFRFGSVRIQIGYYDGDNTGNAGRYYPEKDDSNPLAAPMIDYEYKESALPTEFTVRYTDEREPDPVKRAENKEKLKKSVTNAEHWGITKYFYLENIGSSDAFFRIYLDTEPYPEKASAAGSPHHPESNKALGDCMDVKIYEAQTRPDGSLQIATDAAGNPKPPLISAKANELTKAWYDAPEGKSFINNDSGTPGDITDNPAYIGSGRKKNYCMTMTLSEEFAAEEIKSGAYYFDICVQAVQTKNQDPSNVEF